MCGAHTHTQLSKNIKATENGSADRHRIRNEAGRECGGKRNRAGTCDGQRIRQAQGQTEKPYHARGEPSVRKKGEQDNEGPEDKRRGSEKQGERCQEEGRQPDEEDGTERDG